MVVFNQVRFRMYENLKSEDASFMEKITLSEYASMQENFVSIILGESRQSGVLQREANRSEMAAKQAASNLALNIEEHQKLSMASEARESALQLQDRQVLGQGHRVQAVRVSWLRILPPRACWACPQSS